MKKIILTITAIATISQATTELRLGVSKEYTQVENQVMAQCSVYDTNFKAFQRCEERVKKLVKSKLKKDKK